MTRLLSILLLTLGLFASIPQSHSSSLLSYGIHNYIADVFCLTREHIGNSGVLTDSYAYTHYGKIICYKRSFENSYLFTGKQRDNETGNYYLRARYYSPNMARFLSRDSYDGTPADPLSQNHYLYASGNPVRFVDPSGQASTKVELVTVIQAIGILAQRAMSASGRILLGLVQRLPAIARGGVRGLAREAEHEIARRQASLTEMEAIYIIARLYARFGDHEEPNKIPIQVYGSNNLPEHQKHIFDAILGFGSNGRPVPFELHKKDIENSRDWLDLVLPSKWPDLLRDEYPYATTYEGGKENYYKGLVSVRYVSPSESGRQGRFIRAFYNSPTPLMDGDKFLVIPIGGVSGYFDKTWKWHSFPKGK